MEKKMANKMKALKEISFGEKIVLFAVLCCTAIGLMLGRHWTRRLAAGVTDLHAAVMANHDALKGVTGGLSVLKRDFERLGIALTAGKKIRESTQGRRGRQHISAPASPVLQCVVS